MMKEARPFVSRARGSDRSVLTIDDGDRSSKRAQAALQIDSKVLGRITTHWLQSKRFPDVDATLLRLGVRQGPSGVFLDDSAPDAAIRKAIMAMGK